MLLAQGEERYPEGQGGALPITEGYQRVRRPPPPHTMSRCADPGPEQMAVPERLHV